MERVLLEIQWTGLFAVGIGCSGYYTISDQGV